METLTALSLLISPLATLVIAVCAYVSLRRASDIVFRQGAPRVIVYVKDDRRIPGWLMIRVQNIGQSVAVDIKFQFERHLIGQDNQVIGRGPLIEGISILAPGDFRDYVWGRYADLVTAVGTTPIGVTVKYSHIEEGKKEIKHTLSGNSKLDIMSYAGTNIDLIPDNAVETHLGSISASVKKIADKPTTSNDDEDEGGPLR